MELGMHKGLSRARFADYWGMINWEFICMILEQRD
jgi:hypothetical protein